MPPLVTWCGYGIVRADGANVTAYDAANRSADPATQTFDSFATHKVLVKGGNQISFSDGFVFVAQVSNSPQHSSDISEKSDASSTHPCHH